MRVPGPLRLDIVAIPEPNRPLIWNKRSFRNASIQRSSAAKMRIENTVPRHIEPTTAIACQDDSRMVFGQIVSISQTRILRARLSTLLSSRPSNLRGIGLGAVATFTFAVETAVVRHLSQELHPFEIAFFAALSRRSQCSH